MTAELDATIARLRELDAKRTPGRWEPINAHSEYGASVCSEVERDGNAITSSRTVVLHDRTRWRNSADGKADMEFIASAPEMMAVINALVGERDTLQSENARLMQANSNAAYREAELTARLIDAERNGKLARDAVK